MSDTSSDILMKFVHNGGPILGESQTALSEPGAKPHRLLSGFRVGHIIELDSFTFSLGVQDPNNSSTTAPGVQGVPPGQVARPGMRPVPGQSVVNPAIARAPGLSSTWAGPGSKSKYPISVQPISFTRTIDRSSTELLHFCIHSVTLDSASLIKRKAAGGKIVGEPYLRLDFSGVLITNIAWTSGEPVKETTKFISRAITVRYRPQLPDGSLGAARHGFWSMNPWEREAPL